MKNGAVVAFLLWAVMITKTTQIPFAASAQTLTQKNSVSDTTAYRLFITMLAKRPGNDPSFDDRRRRSYLKHYFNVMSTRALTDEQISRILSTVDSVQPQLIAFGDKLAQHASDSRTARDDLDRAITEAMRSLIELDPDAARKLQSHVIEHVKAATTVGAPQNVK